MHRVVIVGGGAGGLELATRLGDTLGRRGHARITLVDRARTHLWKPLLHEVAAGSIDVHAHQLDYLAQARWHHFRYAPGALAGLDRRTREVLIDAVRDETGAQVLPARRLPYDTLVIAIGSLCNDFGTPGVQQHAFTLENAWQANLFHRRLVNACLRANYANDGRVIHINIVGAGATGVELAAELHNTLRVLAAYGLEHFLPDRQIRIAIVEAGPRVLAGLPDYLADATLRTLEQLGIAVHLNERVTAVCADGLDTAGGQRLQGEFCVWAAGIRCDPVLCTLDGLEVNHLNQLVVRGTLQTTHDENIFAIGDCAAAPWRDGRLVPPRAQSAHQMASTVATSIRRRLQGRPPGRFHYRDFGSLVSLGSYQSVGTLMGFVTRGSVRVEGLVAKLFYVSLYKLHLWALHGFWRMALDTLARAIRTQTDPRVKLH
jgi:NADH dehydrogenase